jgi:hypothetical protein
LSLFPLAPFSIDAALSLLAFFYQTLHAKNNAACPLTPSGRSQVVVRMREVVRRGLGLSAAEVGLDYRCFSARAEYDVGWRGACVLQMVR